MIKLILTNSLDNTSILQAIKDDYASGLKQIVLVPDRFTLSYEKSILEFLNIRGSFDIEVASFSRLANKNLQDKTNLIDMQTEMMLLRKIVEDNKSKLLSFKNSSDSVGFAKELGAVISQIRNSGISCSKIVATAEKMPIKLANKMRDIALIYSEYVEALTKEMSDGTSKLEALASHIPNMELGSFNLYIAEFLSLSKIELDIVEKLMQCCKNCTIAMVDGNGANSRIFPKSLILKIKNIAKKMDLPLTIEVKKAPLPKAMEAISNNLFGYTIPTNVDSGNNVALHYCNSIKQEIKQTAQKIVADIKSGIRFKDIAVVCCDSENYLPTVCEVFEKFEIPYFADNKQNLSNMAISQLVFSFIKVVENKFRRVDVVGLCKQTLLEFDFNEVCRFENYCLKYGIDYSRFVSKFSIGKEEEIVLAENVRSKMSKYFDGVDFKSNSARGHIKNILKFFENIDIRSKVDDFVDRLIKNENQIFAKSNEQSYEKIVEILTQFEKMLGTCQMDASSFLNILSACVASVQINLAPMYVDSVFVGEISQSRFENIKALYIVGASEGAFPMQHSDIGIVGEKEINALAVDGLIVEPNAKQMNYSEKLKLLMLLLKPTKKLSISCALTNGLGAKVAISGTVNYISEILGIEIKSCKEPNDDFEMADYLNYYVGQNFALENLFDLQHRLQQNLLLPSSSNQQMLDLLYHFACQQRGQQFVDSLICFGGKESQLSEDFDFIWQNGVTSPSQLEKYFNCPFSHYIDYILKASRREKADLEMSDMGTVLHEVAQKYFEGKDSCDMTSEVVIQRIQEIYKEIVKTNIKLQIVMQRQNGAKVITELYDKSCKMLVNLVRKMQVTKFRPLPTMLEKRFGFGEKNDLPAVQLDFKNKVVNIRGVIDRIDCFDDKFLIIDYKSKVSIDFEPTNIVFGERCQMFIYLNAVMSASLTPAGLYYILMSDKMKKEEERENLYKYIGYSNVNFDNVADFDKTLSTTEKCESKLYPIKIKSNKEGAYFEDKTVLLGDDLKNIAGYTKKLCQKAVSEIGNGYVKSAPIVFEKKDKTVCDYCEYKKMCGVEDYPQNKRIAKAIDVAQLRQIAAHSNGLADNESITPNGTNVTADNESIASNSTSVTADNKNIASNSTSVTANNTSDNAKIKAVQKGN